MKSKLITFIVLLLVLLGGCSGNALPSPKADDSYQGKFGIDVRINMSTIDKYLDRSDVVYRDMRMLVDVANYEALGGDSYLSGFIRGFEVVPLPFLVNVTGLPDEVGDGYQGETLFELVDGAYVARYQQAQAIIEYLFPRDKAIFLMCGGGGYAAMAKDLLLGLGWSDKKLYNVGGYWSYVGDNSVSVKRVEGDVVHYDFWKVAYHDIDFTTLERI